LNLDIDELYADVTGPLDTWWRNADWMRRGIVQRVCTPTVCKAIAARIATLGELRETEKIEAVVPYLESPEIITELTNKTIARLKRKIPYSRGFADNRILLFFNNLGKELVSIIDNKDEPKALVSIKEKIEMGLFSVLRDTANIYQIESSFQLDLKQFETSTTFNTEMDLAKSIDRLRLRLLVLRNLQMTKRDNLTTIETFLRKNVNRLGVEEYQESLTGIWDSLVLLWQSNATIKLNSELEQRFKRFVLKNKQLNVMVEKIQNSYKAAEAQIFAEAFNLAESSIVKYPAQRLIKQKLEKLQAKTPSGLFDSNGLLRAQVFIELVGTVDFGVGLGLIVYGLASEPISGGASTIVVVIGAIVFVAETTAEIVKVVPHDISKTSILAITHKILFAQVMGDSNPRTVKIGKSDATPPTSAAFPTSSITSAWQQFIVSRKLLDLERKLFR
jgi:hypothetical protein